MFTGYEFQKDADCSDSTFELIQLSSGFTNG